MVAANTVTVADGQLLSSAGTILDNTSLSNGWSGHFSLYLSNTSASLTQTIVITMKRAGGTARRIARFVLAPNEQAWINNFPFELNDTLLGVTTNASTVDYMIVAGGNGSLSSYTLDANGAVKQVNTGVSGNQTISGVLTASGGLALATGVALAGAGSTNSDAAAIASGTSAVHVTGANGTVGVILPAQPGLITLLKNDDSANAILKVYPPAGAAINALTATTGGYSMAAKTCGIFWQFSSTQVYTLPLLIS